MQHSNPAPRPNTARGHHFTLMYSPFFRQISFEVFLTPIKDKKLRATFVKPIGAKIPKQCNPHKTKYLLFGLLPQFDPN